jgi:hypothetical protein
MNVSKFKVLLQKKKFEKYESFKNYAKQGIGC